MTNTITYISAKDAAAMLRNELKSVFPGIKFSVRLDRSTINVRWTGGPLAAQVERIARNYSGQGFDGMTDCRYPKTSYITKDKRIRFAHSNGGSNGKQFELPPTVDSEMCRLSTDFVFCTRDSIDEQTEAIFALAMKHEVCEGRTFLHENYNGSKYINCHTWEAQSIVSGLTNPISRGASWNCSEYQRKQVCAIYRITANDLLDLGFDKLDAMTYGWSGE